MTLGPRKGARPPTPPPRPPHEEDASQRFRLRAFLARSREGRTIEFRRRQILFAQGEPAAAVFYILKGTVKRVVVSKRGREAVIALLGPGAVFCWRGGCGR